MKKIFFLSLLCVSLNALHAADPEADDLNSDGGIELRDPSCKAEADALELKDPEKAEERIVPNASFKSYGSDWLARDVYRFHDADGNELLKTRDAFRTIDPQAPKPRAKKFKIGRDQFGYYLYLYTGNDVEITQLNLQKRLHLGESKDDVSSQVDLSTLDDKKHRALECIFKYGCKK